LQWYVVIYQGLILFDIFFSEEESFKTGVQNRYIEVVVYGKNNI